MRATRNRNSGNCRRATSGSGLGLFRLTALSMGLYLSSATANAETTSPDGAAAPTPTTSTVQGTDTAPAPGLAPAGSAPIASDAPKVPSLAPAQGDTVVPTPETDRSDAPSPSVDAARKPAQKAPALRGPRVLHPRRASDSTESEPPSQPPVPMREPGYRGTIALADLANLATHLLAAAAFHKSDWFGDVWPYTAIGGYLLTGPIVHAAHGRSGRVGESVGVRVAAPLAFAFVGMFAVADNGVGAGIVVGAGAASAMVFDALVLGRGDIIGVQQGRTLPALSPWFEPRRGRMGLSSTWMF